MTTRAASLWQLVWLAPSSASQSPYPPPTRWALNRVTHTFFLVRVCSKHMSCVCGFSVSFEMSLSLSLSTYLPPQADALFKLLSPLVKDQADQPVEPPDPDDFEEEQMTMACLVDLFRAQEPDQQYMVRVWWGTI